jgi:electron transport complex protein RnfE
MQLSILLSEPYRRITRDGLWDNNVVFTQQLALCPLLAVTGTATNALGMGLATTVVMVASNGIVSLARHLIPTEIRIPIYVLLIAALVTLVDLLLNAWLHELHKVLGLFIPLIVTNCVILGRAETFASKQAVPLALWDGFIMGVGFTLAMLALGIIREITATGTLFANASVLLGESFSFLELTLLPEYKGFLLTALPPGGFIVLGFLVACKRMIDQRLKNRLNASNAGNSAPLKPESATS